MKTLHYLGMNILQMSTQLLAGLFCVALVLASGYEVVQVFHQLYLLNISSAIQEGLFVMILLEMFYVVRSFIKYGSVNTSLVISIGMLAIVKEIIFKLPDMDLSKGISLAVMFLSLSIGLLIEGRHHELRIHIGQKPRSLLKRKWLTPDSPPVPESTAVVG